MNYQVDKLKKAEHCIFVSDPYNVKGYSNYVINIKENDKVAYSLYLVDSNAGEYKYLDENGNVLKGYEAVDFTQFAYFKAYYEQIINNNHGDIPQGLAFSHFPIKEFKEAYDLATSQYPYDENGNKAELIAGKRREAEGSSYKDFGMFDFYKSIGVDYVFAGHEHSNDYIVKYKDMTMTYGVKTGYFSSHDKSAIGGTHIILGANKEVVINQLYI